MIYILSYHNKVSINFFLITYINLEETKGMFKYNYNSPNRRYEQQYKTPHIQHPHEDPIF